MRDEEFNGTEDWIAPDFRARQPGDTGGHRQTVTFETTLEYLQWCDRWMTEHADSKTLASVIGRTDWCGATWRGALALARTGWAEGSDQVRKLSDRYVHQITNLVDKTVYYYDVSGSYVDVGRYIDGEPEHFVEFATERVRDAGTRMHRIMVQGSFSCDTPHEAIIRRGAAITALVDLLETLGIRCEIVSSATLSERSYGTNRNWFEFRVPLKEADEALDIDRVAFALAHPASLRRLGFAVMESLIPYTMRDFFGIRKNGSYGYPVNSPDTVFCASGHYMGGLPIGGGTWNNGDAYAMDWIKQQLTQLGITLNEGAAV